MKNEKQGKSSLDQYTSDLKTSTDDAEDTALEEEYRRFDAEPRRTKNPDRTDAELFAARGEISAELIREAAAATDVTVDELTKWASEVLQRGMPVDELLQWLQEKKTYGSFGALKEQLEAMPPEEFASPEGRELMWKAMAATPEYFKRELAEELQKAGIYLPCDGGLMEALSMEINGALAIKVFKRPAMSDEELASELEEVAAYLRSEERATPQLKLIKGGKGNDERTS